MAKKAEAYKEYSDAAMIQMLLDVLPKVTKKKFKISSNLQQFISCPSKIAAEVAAPLTQAKKITMVSSGGGEVGAAKLTGEVLSIVSRIPEMVKQMTNIDIGIKAK